MFRLWRSEKRLQERLEAYLGQVTGSLSQLKATFPSCLDGSLARQGDLANPVHVLESAADDMRRELELELVSGKLLPESRADMLALIEAIDLVSNIAENVVELFTIQKLDVPPELHADVQGLLLKSLEACATMAETVRLLVDGMEKVRGLVDEVDHLESECDARERRLLRRIFDLNLERAHQLHLRDLVVTIGSLADQAESVADRVQRLAVKRRF
jgi:predicted phosphate transport protein (TIGR00153 family)